MGHLPKMRSNARAAAVVVKAAIVASREFKRHYREAVLRESRDAYITKITWKEWRRRKERRERMNVLLRKVWMRISASLIDDLSQTEVPECVVDGLIRWGLR